MPQDTTKYWEGNDRPPLNIDSLVGAQRQQVSYIARKETDNSGHKDVSETYVVFIAFAIIFILLTIYNKYKTTPVITNGTESDPGDNDPDLPAIPSMLVYDGNKLRFDDETIRGILTKRFPYFNSLNEAGREKFIKRLKKFISLKTFVIHNTSGFKEMPILVSATAIQISFGLDKYQLPNFTTINIYPYEFLGTYPFVRFLIGNVSGNTINLSWKHLLEGFQDRADGQNVAVHEMAHALYYQSFVAEKNVDIDFRDTFNGFTVQGNKVYEGVKEGATGLYSEYATKDFQEFWAESVEIFFEKPIQLKSIYPDLYLVMSNLLHQDTALRALQDLG